MAAELKTISIQVPDDLAEDFRQYAEKTGRTISELVEESLQFYLSTHRSNRREEED